jgi:hypothetical protein
MRKHSGHKLVYGVGLNNADYQTHPVLENGKQKICKYYSVWSDMLSRCYSEKELQRYPTYRQCEVDTVWHEFMNFKSWMETQDFNNLCLDKDIIIFGNKIYKPEACAFVTNETNGLLLDKRIKKRYALGVDLHSPGRYQANCNVNRKQKYLGLFKTELEAHRAWQIAKQSEILRVSNLQTNEKVRQGLIFRYQLIQLHLDTNQITGSLQYDISC